MSLFSPEVMLTEVSPTLSPSPFMLMLSIITPTEPTRAVGSAMM